LGGLFLLGERDDATDVIRDECAAVDWFFPSGRLRLFEIGAENSVFFVSWFDCFDTFVEVGRGIWEYFSFALVKSDPKSAFKSTLLQLNISLSPSIKINGSVG
jgi:hypothetical protein